MSKHKEFEVNESDLYIHIRWHLLNNHNNRICLRYMVVLNKHVLKTTKSKKTVINPWTRYDERGLFGFNHTQCVIYICLTTAFLYIVIGTLFSVFVYHF